MFVNGGTEMDQVLGLMPAPTTSADAMMNVLRRVFPCRVDTHHNRPFAEPARPFHHRRPPNLPRPLLPLRAPADLRGPFPTRDRPTRLALEGSYLLGRRRFERGPLEGFRTANH